MRHPSLLAAAVLAAAISSSPAAASRTYTVVIDELRFGAVPTGLRVGDTIMWENKDLFQHTATARDGTFNVNLAAGKSGKTVLRRRGRISVYCKYHPGMTAQLVVQ